MQHRGTAFFYHSQDTTYLISNYHAIMGWDPLKMQWICRANLLWLKYKIRNGNKDTVIPINIGEQIFGLRDTFSLLNRIDLMRIPINTPIGCNLNCINDLVDTQYFNEAPEKLFAFGYPDGKAHELFSSAERMFIGTYRKKGYKDYDSLMRRKYPEMANSSLDSLADTKISYFFIDPVADHGYSGSPVFGKFRLGTNRSKYVYKFFGVIFAGAPILESTWTIRPNAVYQYLKTGKTSIAHKKPA